MLNIKFHRVYRKNRLEWDDPYNSSVYFIPIKQIDSNWIEGYRYVSTKDKGFLTPATIKLESPFFLSSYTLIESNSTLLLDEIKTNLDEQILDAKHLVLKLVSFNTEITPYIDQLKKNEAQR